MLSGINLFLKWLCIISGGSYFICRPVLCYIAPLMPEIRLNDTKINFLSVNKQQTDSVRISNFEALSCIRCCSRKAVSIKYSKCVFVSLVMQHALLMLRMYWYLWGLSGCSIFFHIILQTAWFSGKQVVEHKMCVLIFSTTFSCKISHSKKNSAIYYHNCTSVFM